MSQVPLSPGADPIHRLTQYYYRHRRPAATARPPLPHSQERHSLTPISNCLVAVHEHHMQRIIFLYADDITQPGKVLKRSFMLGFEDSDNLDRFLASLRTFLCVPSAVNICRVDLELAPGIGQIAPLLQAFKQGSASAAAAG